MARLLRHLGRTWLLSERPGRSKEAKFGVGVGEGLADERGVGVPTALFVALTVFALGATWAQLGIHDIQLSSHERSREQAVNAAEAGVNAAMSALTTDADYPGGTGTLPGGVGEWDVTVEPIVTGDPADLRRLITSTGYAPNRTIANPQTRTLEAEVDLARSDGFEFGLFAGNGTITGANRTTVNGDVYSTDGITLANNTDIQGDVVTPSFVTTTNNSLIAGDIRAGTDVTLENSKTTIQGSVYSGGNVSVNGHVLRNVQAAGTITMGVAGQVDGVTAPQSPPPPVRVERLPTFTWDPNNYSPPPSTWSSSSAFMTNWSSKAIAGLPFNGHHKINSTGALDLDKKWKMDADVTIVTDGPVDLSKEIVNTTTSTLDLVVITTSTSGIVLSGAVTIPDSIRVLLFAPNGPVVFANLKHFSGAVYGESITVDQNFTLTWARPDAPGFTWTSATDVHYRVIVRVLREVPNP